MRKIIVTEFITLDGVIEAPGGNETPHPHGGWQFKYSSPETGKYKIDELSGVDTLLLGKNTYELFAGYWPSQTGGGLRLFDDNRELKKFGLKHSRVIDNGILILEYPALS